MANASPRITLGIFAEDGPLSRTLAATRGKLAAFDKSVRKLERNRAFRMLERDLRIVDRNLTAATLKAVIFGGAVAAAGVAGAAGVYLVAAALATVGVGLAALSGLALVGIGIAFVSQSKIVKAEWKKTTDFIKAEGLKLAKPLEAPMVRLAASVRDAFILIGPSLSQAFSMAAPLVDQFGEGLKNNAESAGATLVSAMSAGIPVLQALGSGFTTYVLPGLRGFFDELTEGSGVLSGFATSLMQGLGNSLPYIGEALVALIPVMRTIHADLVRPMIDGFREFGSVLLANGDSTGSFVQQLGTTIQAALPALANFLVAAQPIGQVFLTLLVPGINAFSGALSAVTGPLKGVASFLENNAGVATALGTAIVGTVVAVKAITTAMTVYRTALAAAAAIQGAFNAVLALNPVFLVVLAIAALIAILVLAYNKVDWFKTAVDAAWNGIKVASIALWNALVAVFNGIVGAISGYVNLIKGYINLWISAFTWVVDSAKNLYNGVVGKIGAVLAFIAGVPGSIRSALGSVGSLLFQAGKDVIQGLINGIKNMAGAAANAAKNAVKGAVDSAKSFLGINSPSRVFMEIGGFTSEGLALGISRSAGLVKNSLNGIESMMTNQQFALAGPDFNSSSLRSAAANRGGTTVVLQPGAIVIEATPGTDRAAIAREIRGILRDGERLGVA